MSDNYDPLSTQTAAFTFRRLDALQDSVAAFGKTAAGAPVAILVAQDGTLQTRRLQRSTDEVILIGTDPQAVARPVLVDSQGRFSPRPLSALPVTDFDAVRAYFVGPASSQIQGKVDADGTVNVNDPTARSTLASILAQHDVTRSALRDAITGAAPTTKTLYALDADLVAALQAVQPRSVTNFPADYPDALAQSRLLSILGQLDLTTTQLRDGIMGAGGTLQKGLFDVWLATDTLRLAKNRNDSEIWDVKTAHGTAASGGLTVTLDLGITGRPHVQRFISVGGPALVVTQVSRDGVTWRTLETASFAVATSTLEALSPLGYRYVRATSGTAGVSLEFELSGSR